MNRFKVINGYIVQERGCILYHKSADEFVSVFHLSHCVEATQPRQSVLRQQRYSPHFSFSLKIVFQLFVPLSFCFALPVQSLVCFPCFYFLSSSTSTSFTCASLSSQVSVWRFNASCDCCGFLFSLSTWGDIVSRFYRERLFGVKFFMVINIINGVPNPNNLHGNKDKRGSTLLMKGHSTLQ